MSVKGPSVSWRRLAELCAKGHDYLYADKGCGLMWPYLEELEAIVARVSDDSRAILYWDAAALAAEMRGHRRDAIRFRQREIELMTELHQLVEDGVDGPEALTDRGVDCLERRRRILRSLLTD
mgnify:CR=1 FL=1